MAQGDSYIYQWTAYNNNVLQLQPSSGVEWMFTAHHGSNTGSTSNGLQLRAYYSYGSADGVLSYFGYTSSTSSTRAFASGVYGMNPLNVKINATNGKPIYWYNYNYSGTNYCKFYGIVINE